MWGGNSQPNIKTLINYILVLQFLPFLSQERPGSRPQAAVASPDAPESRLGRIFLPSQPVISQSLSFLSRPLLRPAFFPSVSSPHSFSLRVSFSAASFAMAVFAAVFFGVLSVAVFLYRSFFGSTFRHGLHRLRGFPSGVAFPGLLLRALADHAVDIEHGPDAPRLRDSAARCVGRVGIVSSQIDPIP